MRHYETVYILRPNLGEDKFTEIIERTNTIVTNDGGTVIDIDRWGIKKLAYEIKKETQGYYVLMNYAAHGTTVNEIERIFRIDDQLLRYLTIKLADSIDEAGINQVKEKIAAEAAAVEAEETEQAEGEKKPSETPAAKGEEKTSEAPAAKEEEKPSETPAAKPETDTEKAPAEASKE